MFCVIAPTWILCAIGLGDHEDESALQWGTRLVGALLVSLALWFILPHWRSR